MIPMEYEVNFYDDTDNVVEGYFFASDNIENIAYDALERANNENVPYAYAILSYYNTPNEALARLDGYGNWDFYIE